MKSDFHSAPYRHVDVFATGSLTGNGLTVFLGCEGWPPERMQLLAQEMRQFESIFLSDISDGGASARVFTVEEELEFAGHPVLGAAAVLHRERAPGDANREWAIRLPGRTVAVRTTLRGPCVFAEMDQGEATFGEPIAPARYASVLQGLGLAEADLRPGLPVQRVSTGLPYLIVAVAAEALCRASIRCSDFEARLAAFGAKFVFVLDPAAPEGRTWDNLGRAEDVATGSAAGPAAAYLTRHGAAPPAAPIAISQGRFAGRPSRLTVRLGADGHVLVSGEVWPVARGTLELVP